MDEAGGSSGGAAVSSAPGAMQGTRDRLARGREKASKKLRKASERAKKGERKLLGRSLKSFVRERHNVNMQVLRDVGYGMTRRSGAVYDKLSREAKKELFKLSVPVRAKVLMALREVIKSSVTGDPDMCVCLKERIEGYIDLIWDDITVRVEMAFDDVQLATLGKVECDAEVLGAVGEKPCTCSPRWWRAWFLYHYVPYDLSILGQCKDPAFWFLSLLGLLPYYGIRVAFFSLYLLCLVTGGPPDNFQLVTYIMGIKGTQFISSGIGMSLYAAVKYYLCVLPGGRHTCETRGPGASMSFASSSSDVLGTCALCWVAFWCFSCSVRSGGVRRIKGPPQEDVEDPASETEESGSDESDDRPLVESAPRRSGSCACCHSAAEAQGGRLVSFLRYDVVCFAISFALFLALLYVDTVHLREGSRHFGVNVRDMLRYTGGPVGQAAIFVARVFYSLLALPFTFFFIPGLQGVLTHTTYTGFNRNGVCVPFKQRPSPEADAKGQ